MIRNVFSVHRGPLHFRNPGRGTVAPTRCLVCVRKFPLTRKQNRTSPSAHCRLWRPCLSPPSWSLAATGSSEAKSDLLLEMKQSRSIRLCLTQCWPKMSMWQCSHLVLPSEKDVCKSSWLKRTGSTLLLERRLTPTMDWKQTLLDSDQSVEKLWTAYQET